MTKFSGLKQTISAIFTKLSSFRESSLSLTRQQRHATLRPKHQLKATSPEQSLVGPLLRSNRGQKVTSCIFLVKENRFWSQTELLNFEL